jgi:NADH-quinone oxidoreductase subunit F
MSDVDQLGIRTAIEPYAQLGRSGMLPALHAVQKLNGWISESSAREIAGVLRVPLADLHGVIEFYTLFYNRPVGRRVIRICTDLACALRGADDVLRHLCAAHNIAVGETTTDGEITVESSPCLGLCEQAPAGLVGDQAETAIQLDKNAFELGGPRSIVGGSLRLLTANCGHGTTSLAGHGDYVGLRRALTLPPGEVTAEIKSSGLVGRGGAAFPTGIKWEGAAAAPDSPKYVVCNADESEPGTFKDRVLLMDDPHTLLEGMLIAGYAIGANTGYIYVRGEYPYVLPVLETAIAEARGAGLLGSDVLGSSFRFDIEVRLGAGAYICGEETALFESIEGKRGFPRIKPPFPTNFGLFGKPTVINNVETLFNVPLIVSRGVEAYRSMGTVKSPGPKLFCVSGDASQPGVYEVPFGVTLRELLDMAGGVAGGRSLQAVLFGGAAGAFATSSHLDVRLTFEDLRSAGLPLGSGVVMVFDETRDMRDALQRLGRFFAHESCGKCYPCQIGTQRQKEILDRIADGHVRQGDFERLQDVGWTMTDSSLCGLGQTAASAVLSATRAWPHLFVNGRAGRRKPAKRASSSKVPRTKRPKAATSASRTKASKAGRSKAGASSSKRRGTAKTQRRTRSGPKR